MLSHGFDDIGRSFIIASTRTKKQKHEIKTILGNADHWADGLTLRQLFTGSG